MPALGSEAGAFVTEGVRLDKRPSSGWASPPQNNSVGREAACLVNFLSHGILAAQTARVMEGKFTAFSPPIECLKFIAASFASGPTLFQMTDGPTQKAFACLEIFDR